MNADDLRCVRLFAKTFKRACAQAVGPPGTVVYCASQAESPIRDFFAKGDVF
jgi:hypothetical protein